MDHVPVAGRTFHEVASDVLDKLIAQGGQSRWNSICLNFGDNGFRCAIGWTMESKPDYNTGALVDVLGSDEDLPEEWKAWMKANLDQASLLQRLHDDPIEYLEEITDSDWPEELRNKVDAWVEVVKASKVPEGAS